MAGFLLVCTIAGLSVAIAMVLSGWGIGTAILAYFLSGWTSMGLYHVLLPLRRDRD
jgi:hypothetical protein